MRGEPITDYFYACLQYLTYYLRYRLCLIHADEFGGKEFQSMMRGELLRFAQRQVCALQCVAVRCSASVCCGVMQHCKTRQKKSDSLNVTCVHS